MIVAPASFLMAIVATMMACLLPVADAEESSSSSNNNDGGAGSWVVEIL
jgi:hypothetical protein